MEPHGEQVHFLSIILGILPAHVVWPYVLASSEPDILSKSIVYNLYSNGAPSLGLAQDSCVSSESLLKAAMMLPMQSADQKTAKIITWEVVLGVDLKTAAKHDCHDKS